MRPHPCGALLKSRHPHPVATKMMELCAAIGGMSSTSAFSVWEEQPQNGTLVSQAEKDFE